MYYASASKPPVPPQTQTDPFGVFAAPASKKENEGKKELMQKIGTSFKKDIRRFEGSLVGHNSKELNDKIVERLKTMRKSFNKVQNNEIKHDNIDLIGGIVHICIYIYRVVHSRKVGTL